MKSITGDEKKTSLWKSSGENISVCRRSMAGFWINSSLNKYSVTCRVNIK